MSSFVTVNPAAGAVVESYQHILWPEAEQVVMAAHRDFLIWRAYSFVERRQILFLLAERLRQNKEDLAQLMHLEMGKLKAEAFSEVEKCAVTCEYFAEEAASMLANRKTASSYSAAEVSFQPLGVIFSIMPWNFPLWQVIRFAAPALMAGNVVVLKHADITAGVAVLLAKIFKGLTEGFSLLHNCHVDHQVAEQVIAHPAVRGVTFTGSSSGGRQVAIVAAQNLKKIVLELGGSDAYLILEDADIKAAAKACAQTRTQNCGQSCVAGKRFIVVEKVAKLFIEHYVSEMNATVLAPLAAKKFQAHIADQVEKLKSWGGKVLCGGVLPRGEGAFYPATVVLFEKDHPEIHREEVFGPVGVVIIVKDTKEAVTVANSSIFGLGGGVFTSDLKKGTELIEKELEAGFVVVNDFVKSDPRLPFGGVKKSGYGRELGAFGILEFVNIKTVAVRE